MTRPARPQIILTVQETQRVSPELIRVVAGGPGFTDFRDNGYTDRYVKIMFADPAHELEPPYDLAALRAESPEKLPTVRTYTIRWVDHENQRLAIDFVVHGDDGVAGPWAARAQPGDRIVFTGPGGAYTPTPDTDWHLLVGDHSALPAISSAVEALPADAVGDVIVFTPDPADALDLRVPDGVTLRWLHGDPDTLTQAVHDLPWRDGTPFAFVHGEREAVKGLRRHLTDERGLRRDSLSISAYWARGRVEDEFQAEKREPIGQI